MVGSHLFNNHGDAAGSMNAERGGCAMRLKSNGRMPRRTTLWLVLGLLTLFPPFAANAALPGAIDDFAASERAIDETEIRFLVGTTLFADGFTTGDTYARTLAVAP